MAAAPAAGGLSVPPAVPAAVAGGVVGPAVQGAVVIVAARQRAALHRAQGQAGAVAPAVGVVVAAVEDAVVIVAGPAPPAASAMGHADNSMARTSRRVNARFFMNSFSSFPDRVVIFWGNSLFIIRWKPLFFKSGFQDVPRFFRQAENRPVRRSRCRRRGR